MHRLSRILSIAAAVCIVGGAAPAADAPAQLAGEVAAYAVARGDTWATLGARFGVYPATLAADNHLDPRRPLTAGQQIRIDNRHIVPSGLEAGMITINVPQRMLFFADATSLLAYPIAVGRSTWQTPPAVFSVLSKEEDPTWNVPDSILEESRRLGRIQPAVVPPGPNNPLGRFWIGLSLPGFGIHGTPHESSIYQATTHGCIRLQRDDIEELFDRVEVGTRGRIIYEPILLAVAGGEVYIEVHPDVYRRLTAEPRTVARNIAVAAALDGRIDWALAESALAKRAGIAYRVTRHEQP